MPAGLHVRIVDTKSGAQEERTFDRFPVRVGRNELNDLVLDSPFVSQFHVVIEAHDGAVFLRDLGSLNGTLLRGTGRAPANTPVDLTPYAGEFAIVTLILQLSSVDVESTMSFRRQGRMLGLAEQQHEEVPESSRTDFGDTTNAGLELGLEIGAAKAISQLNAFYRQQRESTQYLLRSLEETLETLDPDVRPKAALAARYQMPALVHDPEFKEFFAQYGIGPDGDSTGSTPADAFAHRAIVEMASTYLPGLPAPTSVDEIAMFLQCLQDTLDVFLRGFVRLREGHRQFEAQMSIGKEASGAADVDSASTPQELGRVLLDFRNGSPEAPRDVEATFADLMIHQVALLNGVMNGVKSLLAELSPAAIERYAEDPRRRGGGGLQIGPFRYRQLWELYAERHSDLADEEREAFGLIFGPDFARAYATFRRTATGQAWSPGAGTARYEPPR